MGVIWISLVSFLGSHDRRTWWTWTATLYRSRLAVWSLSDGRTPGSLEPLLKIHFSTILPLLPKKKTKISKEECQINSSASWNIAIDFSCPRFYIFEWWALSISIFNPRHTCLTFIISVILYWGYYYAFLL